MMRAKIEARDYLVPLSGGAPAWIALVARVAANQAGEERDAIDAVMGKPKASTGDSDASAMKQEPMMVKDTASDAAARKLVASLVARSKQAFTMIWDAIPEDIRLLTGDVPPGYAYGLWALLKERYESTRDDNIADVWSRYTALAQEPNEAYDAYMARVDKVTALLVGAGQEPPSGLRGIILLSRVQPMYEPAVLVLKATTLRDTTKTVDWSAVKTFMLDHERQKLRAGDASASGSDERAMAARSFSDTRRTGGSQGAAAGSTHGSSAPARDLSKLQCFNCYGYGHYARDCPKPIRKQDGAGGGGGRGGRGGRSSRGGGGGNRSSGSRRQDSGSDEEMPAGSVRMLEQVFALGRRYDLLYSDSDVDTGPDSSEEEELVMAARTPARRGTTYAQAVIAGAGVPKSESSREYTLVKRKKSGSSRVPATLASDSSDSDGDVKPQQHRVAAATNSSTTSSSSSKTVAAASRASSASSAAAASTSSSSSPPSAAAAAAKEKERKEKIRTDNKHTDDVRRESGAPKRSKTPIDLLLKKYSWGVDSMASLSVTGNREMLTRLESCAPIPISIADGAVVVADMKGRATLYLKQLGSEKTIKLVVEQVYWNERFDANLLSWGVLRLKGWSMNSGPDGTTVTTPGGTEVAASTRGKLTMLELAPGSERVMSAVGSAMKPNSKNRVICTSPGDVVRLHERLGHVGYERLIKICRAGRTDGVGSLDELSESDLATAKQHIEQCTACKQGKSTKPPFGSRGLDSGSYPGEVMHMDSAHVSLPVDPSTGKRGVAHWLIAVDPHSEGRFSGTCLTKDELPGIAIGAMTRCQEMSGKPLRTLYVDNGSEFMNKTVRTYCHENKIQIVAPPPGTPELRGIAERNVRSFKDCARTMLIHSGAPPALLWRYAAQFQAFLWNRTRIAKATGVTPLESLRGRTPSVLHTGVFGCDAWVHQPRVNRLTFDAKAKPAIYLGHDDAHQGPVVLMLDSGKVVRTRDVELREGSFAHMTALREGSISRILDRPYAALDTHAGPKGDIAVSRSPPNAGSSAPSATGAAHGASGAKQGGRPSGSRRSPLGADGGEEESYDASDEDESPAGQPPPASGTPPQRKYVIERVVGHRTIGKKVEYQVKWAGYDEKTWEPRAGLEGAKESIADYYEALRVNDPPLTRAAERASRSAGASASSSSAPDAAIPSSAVSSAPPSSAASSAAPESLHALRRCSRL